MMPDDRRYTESHEWVKQLGHDIYLIGITPRIIRKLGYLIHVDLPDVEDEIMLGLPFGEIESESRTRELLPPMDGTVLEVNEVVFDDLDLLAADPLEKGWLIKIKAHTPEQFANLIGTGEYNKIRE